MQADLCKEEFCAAYYANVVACRYSRYYVFRILVVEGFTFHRFPIGRAGDA
jgi:hypothetical protein